MGSTAEATGDDVASEYVVADGQLVISSPLVGDLRWAQYGPDRCRHRTELCVGADGALGSIANLVDLM